VCVLEGEGVGLAAERIFSFHSLQSVGSWTAMLAMLAIPRCGEINSPGDGAHRSFCVVLLVVALVSSDGSGVDNIWCAQRIVGECSSLATPAHLRAPPRSRGSIDIDSLSCNICLLQVMAEP
jgi:hypothetical protein